MLRTAPAGLPVKALPLHVRLLNAVLPDAGFRVLNGRVQAALDSGAATTTESWLVERGVGDDFLDGYRSWFGREVATHYRAAHNNTDPQRAWVRHRSTDYWVPVFVYRAEDPALAGGARTYRRTAALGLAA
ncbi:hypothetical protein [Streptacidiphilus sp. EB103A]|uniref:hypothetical protein n=1 Tax=Streptacidiphilus sp. EB103A TaxID=3156275 RepID=UPI0035126D98